ncbi:MAG: ATP-binding protein [Clostridiaceae bacterium]|nr:ATP-binding protein [Clostridiaceae bacterium]
MELRYKMPGFQMFVLYGRRRVGKTRLIQEFCKNKRTLFHVGIQQTRDAHLRAFSQDVLEQLPSEGSDFIRQFQSWEDAFSYITKQTREQRIVLVMDEYPYIAQTEPALSSMLQKVIDHDWKQTQLFLILCGSSMSFMEHQVLGYQSPLYGRRTAQLKVSPLPCWESIGFFKHWSWQDALYGYGACGGIPQYLEYFSAHPDFPSAVKAEFLSLSGHLAQEPANLMQQEMREPAVYNSVIDAIAGGHTRQYEIAQKVGKDARDISSYIKALLDLEIVVKKMPVGEKNARKTLYSLADNLYRFWYRFLPRSLALVSLGLSNEAWEQIIDPELDAYFGPIFEDISMQYIQHEVQQGRMVPVYQEYGRWWGNNPRKKREEEIDVVAVHPEEILIGECKWRNEPVDVEVFELLRERGELIRHGRGIRYALFSRSGFTAGMRTLAARDHVLLVEGQDMTGMQDTDIRC